jgi:hypothetical protein
LKRVFQIAISVGLTLFVVLVIQVSDAFLSGRVTSLQAAVANWLAFIRRPDILMIMALTATVTVGLIYWHRDRERR